MVSTPTLSSRIVSLNFTTNVIKDWREAKAKEKVISMAQGMNTGNDRRRWQLPAEGTLKVNVDASVFLGASTFSIGMVIRDHYGEFLEGKNLALPCPGSVFEAESIGMREALSWVKNRGVSTVVVESDSVLTVSAILGKNDNRLEVGHVIDQCKLLLRSMPGVSVTHIPKQTSKVVMI